MQIEIVNEISERTYFFIFAGDHCFRAKRNADGSHVRRSRAVNQVRQDKKVFSIDGILQESNVGISSW